MKGSRKRARIDNIAGYIFTINWTIVSVNLSSYPTGVWLIGIHVLQSSEGVALPELANNPELPSL